MSFLSVWPFRAVSWWARELGLCASLVISPGCGQPGKVGVGHTSPPRKAWGLEPGALSLPQRDIHLGLSEVQVSLSHLRLPSRLEPPSCTHTHRDILRQRGHQAEAHLALGLEGNKTKGEENPHFIHLHLFV